MVSVARSLSVHAMPSDELDWTMRNLDKIDVGKRVEGDRCACNLRDWWSSIRRKVLRSVTETVGPAVNLLGGADVLSLPGAQAVADPRIDRLDKQLANAKVAVVSETARVLKLEEARDKVQQEHDDVLKMIKWWRKTQRLWRTILSPSGMGLLLSIMAYYGLWEVSLRRFTNVVLVTPIRWLSYNYFVWGGAKSKNARHWLVRLKMQAGLHS